MEHDLFIDVLSIKHGDVPLRKVSFYDQRPHQFLTAKNSQPKGKRKAQ